MNLDKINQIVQDYNDLVSLAEQKIKVLENSYPQKYSTSKGIESIKFENDTVSVVCDDSFHGNNDTLYFEFQIHLLSMTDVEINQFALDQKAADILKLEQDKKFKEEFEKKQIEERERKEYFRLKEKFDSEKNS